jgi:hypothetical protein
MNCFAVLVIMSYQQHAQGTGDSQTQRPHSSSFILAGVARLSDSPVTYGM